MARVVGDLPELSAKAGGGLEELEAKAVAIVAEHAAAVGTKLLEQPSGGVEKDSIELERLASEYFKLVKTVATNLVETESFCARRSS